MASSQSMYQIRVLKKNNCTSSMTAPFTGEQLNFGRGEQCSIRIGKETVSEVHAFIAKKNNKFMLSNTSKTNPTYVNGAPVHGQIELKANDIIEIGERNFRWELQSRLKTPKKLPPPMPVAMKPTTPAITKTAPVVDAENMPQNQQAPTTPSTGAFKKKLSITYTPKVLKSATKKVSIDPKVAASSEIDQIFEPLDNKNTKTPLKRVSDIAQTPGANRTRTSAATPGSTSRFVKQPIDGDSSGESSDKEDLEDLIRPQSAKKTPKQLFAEEPAKAKEPEQPQSEKADTVQPSAPAAPVAETSSAPAIRKSDARRSLMASSSILNLNNLRNSTDGRRSSHSRRKSANDVHLASPAPRKSNIKVPNSEKALHEKRKSLSRTDAANLETVPEEDEVMEFQAKAKEVSPVNSGYQSPSDEVVGSTKKNTPLVNERMSTPRRKSLEEFAEDVDTSRQLFDDADAEMEIDEPAKAVEAETPAPVAAPVEEKVAEVVAPVEEKTEERQSIAPVPSPVSEKVEESEAEEETKSEKTATPLGNFNAVVYKKFDSDDDLEAEMAEMWEFLREQTDESGERLSKKLFRLPTAKAKASKLYYDVVSNPIDMGMIKKAISNGMSIEELLENFQRLFANARTFDEHSPCEETMEHVDALESLFYVQFQKRFVASGKIQVPEKKAESKDESESEAEEESEESASEEEETVVEPVKAPVVVPAPAPAPVKVVEEPVVEEKKAPKQPLTQRAASPAAKKVAVEAKPEPKQEEKEESSSEEEEEEQSSKQPSLSEEEIRDMKVVELKAELKKRGKHVGGLKAELVKRLIEAVSEEN